MSALKVFASTIGPPTTAALIVITVVSALLNYAGIGATIPAGSEAFWWKALAAAVSVAVGAALTIVWVHAFGIAPDLPRWRHRSHAVGVVVAFLGIVLALSSVWNVTGLTQYETARLSVARLGSHSAEAVGAARQRLLSVDPLLVSARSLASDLDALAEAERRGEASGAGAGCGPICLSERNAARAVRSVVETAEGQRNALMARLDETAPLLAELQSLSGVPGPAEDAFGRAGTLVRDINAAIAETVGADLPAVLEHGLAPVAGSFVAANLRTADQRAQIADVRGMVEARVAPILSAAAELRAAPPPVTVRAEMPNAMLRAFVHWRAILAQWAAGIALDLAPLFILAFRMIAADAIRRGEPDHAGRIRPLYTAEQLRELRDVLLIPGAVSHPDPAPAAPPAPRTRRGRRPKPNGRGRGAPAPRPEEAPRREGRT